jgi:maltose/moltooligosaccharide transporter
VYSFIFLRPLPPYFWTVRKNSQLHTDAIEWAGICIAVYNGICFIFSWLLPKLTEIIKHKIVYSLCLICGWIRLISLVFIDKLLWVLLPMVGFGIA